MKIKLFLFLCILSVFFGCSNDDQINKLKTGSIEISVLFNNSNEPIFDAEISIVNLSEKSITGVDGRATFEKIEEGNYEITAKVPFSDIILKDNVIVEHDKITFLTIYFDHPNSVTPADVDLDVLLDTSYKSLVDDNIFGAMGYSTIWGDIGVDILTSNLSVNFPPINNLNNYDYNPSNRNIEEIWINHYKMIRHTNLGIEAIEDAKFTTELNTNEDVAMAEFKFLRALTYFNLVKLFGSPVVVKSTNLDESQSNVQSQLKTYDLIIEDLIFAQNNLTSSNTNNRASIAAAQALLGKVYMQMAGFPLLQAEKYQKALEQFNKLEGKFSLATNYSDNFNLENSNNNEVLFKVDFKLPNDITSKSWDWFFWGPKGDTQMDVLLLTEGFIKSYFENEDDFNNIQFPLKVEDKRFFENIASFTIEGGISNNSTQVEDWRPYKLSENYYKGNSFHLPILRYADVLLMIAEAENAINGPSSKAYNAINEVRRRAYGNLENDIPSNLNQQELLDLILNERCKELCYEGHRKDDLIRTQKLQDIIDRLNTDNIDNKKNYEPHKYVLPIPQLELELNSNAVQNPGY